MKKILLLSVFLFAIISLFAQTAADSTAAANIANAFDLNQSLVLSIIGGLTWLIGHFVIPKKWTSITLWLEKIVYAVYTALHWFNEKTNSNGTKK